MHKLLFVAVLLPSIVWAADMNGDRRIDRKDGRIPVSYTHLTLPTILRV